MIDRPASPASRRVADVLGRGWLALSLRAGRLVHGRSPRSGRLQVDAWRDGDVERLLVVAQRGEDAWAFLVCLDVATGRWSRGGAWVAPSPRRHDRDALAASVPTRPAPLGALAAVGVVDAGDETALADVVANAMRFPGGAREGLSEWTVPSTGSPSWDGLPGFPPRDPRPRRGHMSRRGGADIPEGPRSLVASLPWMDVQDPHRVASRIGRLIAGAVAGLRAAHDPTVSMSLGVHAWSPSGYAFYAERGPNRPRRLQAAALQPAFAAVIAASPDVVARVDAGRPFEPALAAVLATHAGLPGPLPAALMRRLRAMPPGLPQSALLRAIHHAYGLPLDWVPPDATGWAALQALLAPSDRHLRASGLRLADLARDTGPDWVAATGLSASSDPGAALSWGWNRIGDAFDMGSSLRETLLGPLARSLGLPQRSRSETGLACRVLFGGKAISGVDRLQARWHARHAEFLDALPDHAVDNAWPEAFKPWFGPGGIRIHCLANERALRDEGRAGPDRDGMPGLAHCVGGYGRECHRGSCFVASVRAPDGAGWSRLSTVELTPVLVGDQGWRVLLAQHRGRGNADPPPEAEAAVAAFMDDVRSGAHPLRGAAFGARDLDPYQASYDWRVPGNLERAFEAWRPYLPPSVAGGGLKGLSRLLAEEARDWSEAPDPAPAGMPDFSGEATVRARVREHLEAAEMRALLGRPRP